MPYKLIILDRDGVINFDRDDFVKSVDEWRPIPGSIEAIAKLHQAGFTVVVASNQSGIARQLFTEADLEQMHQKMTQLLAQAQGKIDKIYYCPAGPESTDTWRKPKPGMLLQALNDFKIEAKNALLIGDSYRDLEAASAAGCDHWLVKTGKGEKTLQQHAELANQVPIYDNLAACVDDLIGSTQK